MPSEADFPADLRALESEYELIRELGHGGMAAVYLARKRLSGRLVAIKAIRARYLDDPDALQRFAREARTVADLNHPNIVHTEAIEQIDDRAIAIILEHVPGGTVRDLLRERGALGAEHAETILRDVASALAYAHQRGIVHRDVKPENVFLDADRGRALLSDFGIARQIGGDSEITLLGAALGTPQYMSPEQIDGHRVDGRSDIYSLGVLGWELLTGRRPWAGESLYGVIYKQKHEELPRITSLRPRVPANLLFAIEGALLKDRAKRWQSADEFIERLTYAPPPVLAQDYPAGAMRASSEPTLVFRPALLAPPLTELDEVVAATPSQAADREPVLEPAAVSVGSTADEADEHQPFEGVDYRLPDFGPNADTSFDVHSPRGRVVRGLALLGPLAIAGVSLFVVLGGNSRDRMRGGGETAKASQGSVAMDSVQPTHPTDPSQLVRTVLLDTTHATSELGDDSPARRATRSIATAPSPTMNSTSARGAPRAGSSTTAAIPPAHAESARVRTNGAPPIAPPAAPHVMASARDASPEATPGRLSKDDTARPDSAASVPDTVALDDPFRPPTVPRRASGPTDDAPLSPRGPLPSPRCRIASNADQRACLDAYVSAGDAPMERAFNALVGELRRLARVPVGAADPATVQRVRVEHRAWRSVRDTECRREPVAADGVFWAPTHAQCFNEMARARADELQDAVRRFRRR